MIELAALSRLGEAGGKSNPVELGQNTQATPGAAGARGASDPHRARAGRRRSRGVPAAPPGCPEIPERGSPRGAGAAAAPLCLCTSGELRAAPPAAGRSGSGGGSSFTPLFSSPLFRRRRQRRQRGGKADSARSHSESSRSPLAALSALASPASSARTSFSWTNLVKQAGIYEWKGDQAQRGERCF